jgi:hypothetical protein
MVKGIFGCVCCRRRWGRGGLGEKLRGIYSYPGIVEMLNQWGFQYVLLSTKKHY